MRINGTPWTALHTNINRSDSPRSHQVQVHKVVEPGFWSWLPISQLENDGRAYGIALRKLLVHPACPARLTSTGQRGKALRDGSQRYWDACLGVLLVMQGVN